MASSCLVCHEDVGTERMHCVECDNDYHLGGCSGVSEVTYNTKAESYHKAWKCITCRTAKSRGGPSTKLKPDTDIAILLTEMNRKLDALPALQETVSGIELSIQLMSDKYDEVLVRMEAQELELKNLKKRVDVIEHKKQDETIKQLTLEIQDLEWRSRRLNLEFHGIPRTDNEDLLIKINEQTANRLGVPELTKSDVVAIHRLPSKPDKIPAVIVRFSSQTTRDNWLGKKNKLRGTDTYIAENMTKQTRALLTTTRDWARQKGYRYTWHKNGKVFLRKTDGDRALLIRTRDDLTAIDN